MRRVFVDTGGFFADLVADDACHRHAKDLFDRSVEEAWQPLTTNVVVFETYTLLRKRARNGQALALGFLDDIEDGVCSVVRVTADDEARATIVLRAQRDKGYSFFDALSFAVMERLGIAEAMAFDRDFRDYGRSALR